ncbi:putative bifunctional diguanylate cyclase/phosphodiesterase [Quadrisphaera granulorum]|uniref:putative bifunctional diguanylate cyclase/phosphodiesterase n=1 Tax=Quadrisphaera granulorum TaxID=317664 RepID=UPI00147576B2|nr:bifunctional diguanylate cyclase/phosphodiesterase [Quadrisphaera granulorum]
MISPLSAALRGLPPVAAPQELGRTTGAFYAAGGVMTVLAALADPGASGWLFVLGVAAIAAGALLLTAVTGRRVPRGGFHVLVGAGTALTTLAVLVAPSTSTALVVSTAYFFVAVDTFSYFRRIPGMAQLALLLAAAAWCTTERGVPLSSALALCVALTTTASVAGHLAARAARASHDPLTGLLNRRGFERSLEVAVVEAERTGGALSVALVDVDAFKAVNDGRGHAGGDALLLTIAEELRSSLPAHALIGRLGGDEFAIALPRSEGPAAAAVVETARSGVRHPLSAGVASRLAREPASECLRRADAALYEAKQLGRNRTARARASTGTLARDLAAALADPDGGGLRVVLQPLVELPSGRVRGLEALVRWNHPERGELSPALFVPVAEQTGQIIALGALVRRAAFRDVAALASRMDDTRIVSVNASGHELVEPDYADAVLEGLADAGLDATSLVLEVTESVVEGSTARALDTLTRLRAQGVTVAVDDFGIGYSTFSRLDALPADYLKLDRAFLDGAVDSPRRRALLETALGVGRALDLPVVTEGVETAEQAQLVVSLGCRFAQGYFFSCPLPAERVLEELPHDDDGRLTTRPVPAPAEV